MGWGSKLKAIIGDDLIDDLQYHLKEALEEGLDKHIRVAVTGLSRSGKTVFITSLAHHLLESHQGHSLPFFEASSSKQILSVKLVANQPNSFPLTENIQALNDDPPRWPNSTTGLSQVSLAIKYKPAHRLKRLVTETATLYLDIIDYPGEWLLDLPLLNLSFAQWCSKQRALLLQEPRYAIFKSWIERASMLDWQSDADPDAIKNLSQQYTTLLHTVRSDAYALSIIQPGRAVLPGDLEGDEVIQLFPIPCELAPNTIYSPTSHYALLEARYDRYKETIVKQFYREHFSRFDRQVVLVDCLKTLNNGKACFDDMKLALTDILQSFNYSSSGFIRRLLIPRVDKVLFASTKADHVTANQHHNLDKFLELIIQDAQREIRFDDIETACMAIASIRSTEAAEATLDGQTISCLKGISKESGETVALFPGEIPTELPTEKEWNSNRFRFVDFAPKRQPYTHLKAEHHIRLDQALSFLIGDMF